MLVLYIRRHYQVSRNEVRSSRRSSGPDGRSLSSFGKVSASISVIRSARRPSERGWGTTTSSVACGYCSAQFGHLDALAPTLPEGIAIIGINGTDYESSNAQITLGRTLPWLQDTSEADAWIQWGAQWRDVYILDSSGYLVDIYNLTEHDLGEQPNLDELSALLISSN